MYHLVLSVPHLRHADRGCSSAIPGSGNTSHKVAFEVVASLKMPCGVKTCSQGPSKMTSI